jgi:predicted metalloprotease
MVVASVCAGSVSATPPSSQLQHWVGADVATATLVGESRDTRSLTDAWLDSVAQFWTAELADSDGTELVLVADVIPYDPTEESSLLPRCNGSAYPSSFYAYNAFYCHQEKVIVYDAEGLVPDLRAAHGDLAVGVLVAHEYSHAVQEYLLTTGSRLERELQADCHAGAWTSTQAASTSERGLVVRALMLAADPSDTGTAPADAHGTAIERATAFARGYVGGVARCVLDERDRRPPFRTAFGVPTSDESDMLLASFLQFEPRRFPRSMRSVVSHRVEGQILLPG